MAGPVNVAFDTSVLVASMIEGHPRHAESARRLEECHGTARRGFVSTHALAETFAVLSAMPIRPRLHPADCVRLVEQNVLKHLTVVPLNERSYRDAMQRAADLGLAGGIVYDALHVVAAQQAKCRRLYTLNARHFARLAPPGLDILEP